MTVNNIGPHNNSQVNDNRTQRQSSVTDIAASKRRPVDNGDAAPVKDKVNLSTEAIDLNALEASIRQAPDVNATKVVALHNQVNSGKYEIDTMSIAGKMLDLESSLDE